jgi:hypothetical protein
MVSTLPLPVLHAAVSPAGNVPTVNCTLPVKPFTAPTAIVDEAVPGREIVTAAADGVSVKLGTITVTVITVEAVSEPETPVTVMGYTPAAAVLLAVTVKTLLAVALAALKAAVSPAGNVLVVSATLPVKPPDPPIASVELALFGREIVKAAVEGVSVNFGSTTVTVTVVDAVSDPDTPLIVMVEVPAAAVLPAVSVST